MMKRDRLVNQHQYAYKQSFIMATILFVATCVSCSGLLAGSTNAKLQVSTTVAAKCAMEGNTLSFGTYDPISANGSTALTASGNVSIKCTRNTSASITMDQGQFSSQASGTSRAMRSSDGGNYLSYDLYLDPGHSTVWNTVNKAVYAATTGAPATLAIYGRVPASQDVGDGRYDDVVTITANF